MASACERSAATEETRFVTVTMSDGSVMKAVVDEDGSVLARVRKASRAGQIAPLRTLRESIRSVLNTKQDDVALNVLMYVINNEPLSMYRVAKTVPYNFSLTYKKANRLLREGLIRHIPSDSRDRRCRRLFESTVKGLLTAWNCGYMDDSEVYECLRKKWHVGIEELSKFENVFKLIPDAISDKDTAVLQDLSVLAAAVTAYENCRAGTRNGRPSAEEEGQAKAYASRYVLANAVKRVSPGRIVVFASDDYTISYEPDRGKTFVYSCALCDRGCLMTEVPTRTPKCGHLEGILASFSLSAGPRV